MRRECKDHKIWYSNFTAAFWFLIGLALYLIWFTDATWQPMFLLLLSTMIWAIREIGDVRHVKWHMKNDQKGNEYDSKP